MSDVQYIYLSKIVNFIISVEVLTSICLWTALKKYSKKVPIGYVMSGYLDLLPFAKLGETQLRQLQFPFPVQVRGHSFPLEGGWELQVTT